MWQNSYPLWDSVPHLLNEGVGLDVLSQFFSNEVEAYCWGLWSVCTCTLSVCESVCQYIQTWKIRTGRIRLDFLLAFSSELVKTVSSNEIHGTTLHTCGSLLRVRSKCSNTNELAITSETNPDNAVRNCQRNPPKKQEQSLQGQPISKCSNSNRRGNFCLR